MNQDECLLIPMMNLLASESPRQACFLEFFLHMLEVCQDAK